MAPCVDPDHSMDGGVLEMVFQALTSVAISFPVYVLFVYGGRGGDGADAFETKVKPMACPVGETMAVFRGISGGRPWLMGR